MGLRGGVVLRETEPGHCGIYLLTTAGGGIRRQIPPRPGSLWIGRLGFDMGCGLAWTEPGHCGIYLLTTASGNGFVGRCLRAPAPCGLRVGKLGSNI